MKTYKYRIYPTSKQEVKLLYTLNSCRKLYNACLEQRKLAYKEHDLSLTVFDQQKQLPEVDHLDVYAQVLQNVARRVDKTFKNFFRGNGYPRFKSRNRYDSFTYPQHGFKMVDSRLRLSKIGNIKIKLSRPLPEPKTLTIKRDACGDWWASFTVETDTVPKREIINVVGIDVGIEKLATLSTGEYFENKRFIKNQEHKLKCLDRSLSNKMKGSSNRGRIRLLRAKAYRKLQNQRNDYLHKISRYLVDKFDLVAFEDLQIKNMMKNHSLSKAIGDMAWYKLMQFTSYKAEEAGATVVLVDPRNTSQECSQCGELARKSLSVRLHSCPNCCFEADRDLNASFNILNRAIGQELSKSTPVEFIRTMKQELQPISV